MMNIDGQKISISRGDTGMFTITFTGDDAPEDNCTILVSLKKNRDSEEAIWKKRLTVNNYMVTVALNADDTDQPFGQYWWDARILYRDGTVYTPMSPASFKVLEVIGNARE